MNTPRKRAAPALLQAVDSKLMSQSINKQYFVLNVLFGSAILSFTASFLQTLKNQVGVPYKLSHS